MRSAHAGFVGIGDRLEGGGADSDDEVEAAAGDLAGDGIGGAEVGLGVEPPDVEAVAVGVAAGVEGLDDAVHSLLENRERSVLHDGDALDLFALVQASRVGTPGIPCLAVGVEEDSGRESDEEEPEGEPFKCFRHGRTGEKNAWAGRRPLTAGKCAGGPAGRNRVPLGRGRQSYLEDCP